MEREVNPTFERRRTMRKSWKTMRHFQQLLALTAISFALAGCASIVDSGPQTISINSNPPDAKLTVYDMRKGEQIINAKTPYTATLKRGAGYFKSAKYRVVIEKEGYESKEIIIKGKASGWYMGGNLIFGGLIGWLIVDPATGAMWRLDPKDIKAELVKREALFQQDEGLVVVLKDRLSELPVDIVNKMELVSIR
jgi:hypothetical protein